MKRQIINILYIAGSTLIAGVINYLYYPIMLNFLSIEQFWEFGSMVWIFNILWVLTTAISFFLVKEISRDNKDSKLKAIFKFWLRELTIFWVIIYLLFLFSSIFLSSFLKIDNFFLFALTWLIIIFSFSWIVFWSFLQSKWRFKTISLINIVSPLSKLIFWVLFVYAGFSIYGAVGWFIIWNIIWFIIWFIITYKYIQIIDDKVSIWKKNIIDDFKKQKKQIFHYFLSSLILAILMNADILFAKHFFDDTTAWIYAWISIIAKFILFLWMSIETVYYPIIVTDKKINKIKVFTISILYILMWICALVFLYFFGNYILEILKPWFWEYLNLLLLIIIYSTLLALLNFFVKIFIAFNKYLINYILSILLIVFIILLYISIWNDFYSLINIFNYFMFILITISYILLWATKN